MLKIAPSIIAADFARLGEQAHEAEAGGADWLHVDVMDGHFVPNITFGPLIVAALHASTSLPLDVHLMISQPDRYLADFAHAGAACLSVHAEVCPHLHRTVQAIKELGCRAGVALNPATPLSVLEDILPDIDLLLIMSVNPGFGGQRYITTSTAKVVRARAMLNAAGSQAELEVDGGVTATNAALNAAAGASVLVAGTAVFGGPASVAENIERIRTAALV